MGEKGPLMPKPTQPIIISIGVCSGFLVFISRDTVLLVAVCICKNYVKIVKNLVKTVECLERHCLFAERPDFDSIYCL